MVKWVILDSSTAFDRSTGKYMNEETAEDTPGKRAAALNSASLPSGLEEAIAKSRQYHLSTQHVDGYWVEELETNPTITAEYLFFMHFMGIDHPDHANKIVNYLLRFQREDGGWNLYPEAPGDISATVEAYMALKMAGVDPSRDEMKRARGFIISNGGIRSCRVFTKIFLAMLGQSSWDPVPAMPIESIFLPRWFYFNIYEMSSWSRATVVPLSLIRSKKPVFPVEEGRGIKEVFTGADRDLSIKSKQPGLNWPNFFLFVDKCLKWIGKSPWKPFRKAANRKALKWILKHQEPEGDFSGIQPAMFNALIALKLSGYSMDHPAIVKGLEGVQRFIIDREDHFVLQACVSPLWDTAIAANALMDSGVPGNHPALVKAGEWMLRKQVTLRGDWRFKNPNTPSGGWSFEFHNENYPDLDDTAEILMALDRIHFNDKEWKESEMQRALTWLYSMQSQNGGWAAFDQDNDHKLFNQIPFADHGAMLDPPTVDVTGRILWMTGRLGLTKHPAVPKALNFIKSEQEEDGCWYGRWGVNYIYGTFLVLCGLRSIGEDVRQPYIRNAVEWLVNHQNEDGGWGETCRSYREPHLRGQGESAPSQTAWGLIGLVETGEADSDAARRGAAYLINRQLADGSWYEDEFTGTGFPGNFYIKYHMYQQFFPLMALSRYCSAQDHRSARGQMAARLPSKTSL